MRRYAVIALVAHTICAHVNAQEFIGLRTGNYSGSNGMLFNPALPISGKLPWDVNVAAIGICEDNNYISIPEPFLKYLKSSDSILNINYYNPEKVYAHDQVFLQLPSGFVKFNDYAAGLFFTVRNAGYFLSDKEAGGITGLKDIPLYSTTDMPAFNAGTIIWGEVGLNGETTLARNSVFNLYAGANIKYLSGMEALAYRNNSLFTFFKDTAQMSVSHFDSDFDYTTNLGSNLLYDPANYAINGHGLGIDLGIYYTINEKSKFKYSKNQDYLWKLGASLLDFGFIKFKHNSGSYHLEEDDPFVVLNSVLDSIDDIDEFNRTGSKTIYDNIDASKDANNFTMFLPAAITITADRAIAPHFYAEAVIVRRIPRFGTNLIARANTFALTPRYESRILSFYLPMELYEDREFRFGAAARLWFLTIGTDNFFTFFRKDDYSSVNMYAGIKINPFWLIPEKKKALECLKW